MNLVVSIVIYPFILLGVVAEQSVGLGGIVFTMIIFLFFECCTNPNGDFYICCFKFFLPKRYLPIMALLGTVALLQASYLMLVVICLF